MSNFDKKLSIQNIQKDLLEMLRKENVPGAPGKYRQHLDKINIEIQGYLKEIEKEFDEKPDQASIPHPGFHFL